MGTSEIPGASGGQSEDRFVMKRTEAAGVRGRALVLVVDDDAGSLSGLGELLSSRFDVCEAADGERALELARELRPDLILMDVYLPNLDGISAHGQLLKDARTQDIPVIFTSAPLHDLPARCLELGG